MNQRYPKLNEQWLPRDTYNRVYTVIDYTEDGRRLICTYSNDNQFFYRDLTGGMITGDKDLRLTTYLRTL